MTRRMTRTFDGGIGWTDDRPYPTGTPNGVRHLIGTAIGLAIAGIAGATGSVVAAKMGSDAAKEGAGLQAKAADQAAQVAKDQLAENKRQFDMTQAANWQQYLHHQKALAPYQGIGVSATNTLADMMHMPIAHIAPPPTPDFITNMGKTTTGQQPNQPPPFVAQGGQPNLTSMLQRPATSTSPPMGQQGGQMVMLRAPNGQTRAVPANQVQHYTSQGATLVNATA